MKQLTTRRVAATMQGKSGIQWIPQRVKKVFLTRWWTGEQALPPLPSSIRNGRPASSHRAAFSGPVFRGCALRFAPCARHFSPSGLRCSQAHSRLSLPYWGLRTGLRFAGPVFRGCGALRAVLAPPPLRGFDDYGLFRAQRARFVRPKFFFTLLTNTSRCDIINASQCDISH